MTRPPLVSTPFLLAFETDRFERPVKPAAEGYPPYNVERLARTDELPERLRITIAVAGFSRDTLDITVEDRQLVVRGRQVEEAQARTYLHRGIAARQFSRGFLLAEGMEVVGADLADGLLTIEVARPRPERVVRTITIADRG